MKANHLTPVGANAEHRPALTVLANALADPATFFVKWEKIFTGEKISSGELGADLNDLKIGLLRQFTMSQTGNDRRQAVAVCQRLLTLLSNRLYQRSIAREMEKERMKTADQCFQHIDEALKFLEETLGHYFNKSDFLPLNRIALQKNLLKRRMEDLKSSVEETDAETKTVLDVLFVTLQVFVGDDNRRMRYRDITYFQTLLNELYNHSSAPSAQNVREVFYYMNYNAEGFFALEVERLSQKLFYIANAKTKIAVLKQEQKEINQLVVRIDHRYSTRLPGIKERVDTWINEEVKFLESGYYGLTADTREGETQEKIHTSLSVAKLAVIVRLLVIDKIIINRTVAPMLRIVAKFFTTLQRDEVSFGSLESKYHAPDKVTINAVRDMLFKWISILGKL
jgi:hypothetical protein